MLRDEDDGATLKDLGVKGIFSGRQRLIHVMIEVKVLEASYMSIRAHWHAHGQFACMVQAHV